MAKRHLSMGPLHKNGKPVITRAWTWASKSKSSGGIPTRCTFCLFNQVVFLTLTPTNWIDFWVIFKIILRWNSVHCWFMCGSVVFLLLLLLLRFSFSFCLENRWMIQGNFLFYWVFAIHCKVVFFFSWLNFAFSEVTLLVSYSLSVCCLVFCVLVEIWANIVN